MTTYYNHNPKFYVGIDCIISDSKRRTELIAIETKF